MSMSEEQMSCYLPDFPSDCEGPVGLNGSGADHAGVCVPDMGRKGAAGGD